MCDQISSCLYFNNVMMMVIVLDSHVPFADLKNAYQLIIMLEELEVISW